MYFTTQRTIFFSNNFKQINKIKINIWDLKKIKIESLQYQKHIKFEEISIIKPL